MLEFREIDILDKAKINSALKKSDFMGCEYSFANNMAWRRLSGSKIAFYKDFYLSCSFLTDDSIPSFIFPAGNGDYKEIFLEMNKISDFMGKPLRIWGVTDKLIPLFEELFPGQYSIEFDRDSCDYIYNSSDLIKLNGKKYHAKRNHLAKFRQLEYQFTPIAEKDFDDCILFSTETYNRKSNDNNHSFVAEQFAINTYFSYYNELNLKGGIIRIDNKIVAVSIGENLNSDTFCVHIEKADTLFNGIYVGINNCMATEYAVDCKYINREEDLGIDGLRKSKLSYYPAFLLNKYTVTFK